MANLPEEIIDQVLKRLSCIEDIVRSEAVCKSWQSIVKRFKGTQISLTHPWLMLARNDSDPTLRSFYCLSTKKVFNFKLPQLHERRCWGSPYGWLVTFGLDLNIHLFNPFSKLELPLPPQPTFQNQFSCEVARERLRKGFVGKFVLSSSPSSTREDCVVLAICGECRTLAFAEPGDEVWTPIICSDHHCFEDALLFKGQFYAVNNSGVVVVCEINMPNPTAKPVAPPPKKFDPMNKAYLVELSGELLLIERVIDRNQKRKQLRFKFHYGTKFFRAYKLNVNKSWEEVFDLGEYALFFGGNTSFAVSTAKNQEYKRNNVYFTDDHALLFLNKFCDMGVVDFGRHDSKAKPPKHMPIYSGDNMFSDFFKPTFIVPNF